MGQRNFVPVQLGDPVFQLGEKLVCARAGDLVLWDSRCVHCNTPGMLVECEVGAPASSRDEPCGETEEGDFPASTVEADPELLRVVAYVCMSPSVKASPDTLSQRKHAFLHNVTANHWPNDLDGAGDAPPWPPPQKWSEANEEQK